MGGAEAEVGGAHEELPPEPEPARGGGGRRHRAGDGRHLRRSRGGLAAARWSRAAAHAHPTPKREEREGLVLGGVHEEELLASLGLALSGGRRRHRTTPTTSPRPGGRNHGPQVSVGAGGRDRPCARGGTCERCGGVAGRGRKDLNGRREANGGWGRGGSFREGTGQKLRQKC